MTTLKGLQYQYGILKEWLIHWKQETKKAYILWGTPGVGKTSLIYALAEELNYDIIEFNASVDRGKDFTSKLSIISRQTPFSPSLILLDEADGLESKAGYKEIFEKTKRPIFLTANEINKLSSIRKYCKEIFIPKPKYADVNCSVKDYRQAQLMKQGSEGYSLHESRNHRLLHFVKEGTYDNITYLDSILYLDSSPQLYGYDAYRFVKGLACYDYCKRSECLHGLKVPLKEIKEVYFSKKKYLKKEEEV